MKKRLASLLALVLLWSAIAPGPAKASESTGVEEALFDILSGMIEDGGEVSPGEEDGTGGEAAEDEAAEDEAAALPESGAQPAALSATDVPVWDPVPPLANKAIEITGTAPPLSEVTLYYRWFYEGVPGEWNEFMNTIASETGGFAFTPNMSEGVYEFAATATVEGTESAESAPVRVEYDFTPPVIYDIYPDASSDHRSIRIAWEVPMVEDPEHPGSSIPDPDYHRFILSKDGADIWSGSGNTYLDEGLPKETLFRYELAAEDAAGNRSDGIEIRAATFYENFALIEEGNPYYFDGAISGNGKFVAYRSADPFDAGVYLYDVDAGTKAKIAEVTAWAYQTRGIAMSGDGRTVVYQNRTSGGSVEYTLFAYDRILGQTRTLAIANAMFEDIGLSADGKYAVFSSGAVLTDGDTNEATDVFVADLTLEDTVPITRASLAAGGIEPMGNSMGASISGDGRFVAFSSEAEELLPAEAPRYESFHRLFVYEIATGELTFIPMAQESGATAEWQVTEPSLSYDGGKIAFHALNGTITNYNRKMLVVYDRSSNERNIVHELPSSSDIDIQRPYLSADGGYILADYVNYDASFEEAPFAAQRGAARFAAEVPGQIRHIGWLTGSTRDARMSSDGKRVMFTTAESSPGYQVYSVCLECEGGGGSGSIESAQWSATVADKIAGQLKPGANVSIQAVARTGQSLEAVVAYSTRSGDGTTSPAQSTVPLTELSAGLYRGAFVLPAGAAELSGIRVRIVGGAEEKAVGELPITVAGKLNIRVQTADPQLLDRTDLIVSAPGIEPVTIPVQSGVSDYSAVVPSGYEYQIRLQKRDGNELALISGVAMPAGAEVPVDVSPFGIYLARMEADLVYLRYLRPGQPISVSVMTEAGSEAEARVAYRTADGSQEMTVALTGQPGSVNYSGSFALPPEAIELTSVVAAATRGDRLAEKETLRAPAPVTGSLTLRLSGSPAIEKAAITVSSASVGVSRKLERTNEPELRFESLPPAADYRITAFDGFGNSLLAEPLPPATVASAADLELAVAFHFSDLTVTVLNDDGIPLRTTVTVYDEESVARYAEDTDGAGRVRFPNLLALLGKTVRVVANGNPDLQGEFNHVVEAGSHQKTLEMEPRNKTRIYGKVTLASGMPAPNAVVYAKDGVSVYTANAEADGSYSLIVKSGFYELHAQDTELNLFSDPVGLSIQGGEREVQHVLRSDISLVDVNFYTRYAGQDWVGPYELDWREATHYRFSFSHQRNTYGNPFLVRASPGETVRLCASGSEAGLPNACAEAVIGEDRTAEMEIRLSDLNARVTADLSMFAKEGTLSLYRLDEGGKRGWYSSRKASPGELTLSLPYIGQYELTMQAGNQYASVRFRVGADDIARLGRIVPVSVGAFAGAEGNYAETDKSTAAQGDIVQVIVRYRNGKPSAVSDAKVVADVPQGASFVEGSAVLNGVAVEPEADEGRFLVPVGNLQPRASGGVSYKLRLDGSPPSETDSLSISPRMQYVSEGTVNEEPIGVAALEVAAVTIEAPTYASSRKLRIGGTAVPGSALTVFEGNRPVGAATASPTGYWSSEIEVKGEAASAVFRLSAIAEKEGDKWYSEMSSVRYDRNYPEVVSFSMMQTNGRKVSVEPGASASRFPYVFVPGTPFVLSAEFNRPERVKDVKFTLGTTVVDADLAEDGTYKAIVSAKKPGPIGIDYTPVEQAESIGSNSGAAEEVEAQLPDGFRNRKEETVDVSPRSADGKRQTASYAAVLPTARGDAEMKMNVSLERVTYVPTQQDIEKAEQTGVPFYGTRVSHSFRDGKLTMEMVAYIPEEAFDALNSGVRKKADLSEVRASSAAGQAVSAVAARVGMAFASKAGENTWKTIDAAYSLADGVGVNDTLKEMEDFLDEVSLNCSPASAKKLVKELDKLHTKLIVNEVFKAGIMVGGAVMGPATFGLGTIALFLVGNGFGKLLDAEAAGQFDRIKAAYAADPQCDDDDDDYDDRPRKPKRELADPVWIYDPSGFIYEIEESNRIEGVKATALQWDEEAGRWVPWDAEWYGQQNPLYTDPLGKYGWDVPEGKWKVRYEKEGFLPAESRELTVLPPHFDVNIGMISILPPSVERIVPAVGGTGIDVRFDRHVLGTYANGLTIAVLDADGTPVNGTVALVDPAERDGESISRIVRFSPDEALQIGAEYEVIVSAAVQSYNGVPMDEDYRGTVRVSDRDETPPEAVRQLDAVADAGGILVQWLDPKDDDLSTLEIEASRSGDLIKTTVEPGKQWASLEGLASGTEYRVTVRAIDEAGNASVASTTVATASPQARNPDVTAPSEPGSVQAKPGGASGIIDVSWEDTPDDDLASVRLSWRQEGQTAEAGSATAAKGVMAYKLGGLAAGKPYELRLSSLDESGNESYAVVVYSAAGASGSSGSPGGPAGGGAAPAEPNGDGRSEKATLTARGGQVKLFGGEAELRLPEGAVTSDTLLEATRSTGSELDAWKPSDAGLSFAGAAYTLKAGEVLSLKMPGTLTLKFDRASLSASDMRKLGIYRLVATSAGAVQWIYAGGTADAEAGTVTAKLEQFGTYAVLLANYTFDDLRKHWAQEEIERLAAYHLLQGTGKGRFEPGRPVTRAEFAKLIVGLLRHAEREAAAVSGMELSVDANAAGGFSDVSPDAWYADWVKEAAALGLVRGAGGKFRPQDRIAREEAIVMMARALELLQGTGSANGGSLDGFSDSGQVSPWAREGAARLAGLGLLQGTNGKLEPKAEASRAEAGALGLRWLEYVLGMRQ